MKLIIHAGFTKTGSTAIQTALEAYAQHLEAEGIFRLGHDLKVGSPGNPQWILQEAQDEKRSTETIAAPIRAALSALPSDATAIISSENLEFPTMPRLFAGLDKSFDCSVLFYARPQFAWIPSAWKQWYLKDGTTLPQYVETCLQRNMPGYLAALSAWREALPNAAIRVKPLARHCLAGGNILTDFFALIGSTMTPVHFRANENIDYSLLHLMSRNAPLLFSGPHDAAIEAALMEKLPDAYRATNAPMLNQSTAMRIHDHFREENLTLLREFSLVSEPAEFLEQHFAPRIDEQAYIDMDEHQILERASLVLMETFGQQAFSAQLAGLLRSLKPREE